MNEAGKVLPQRGPLRSMRYECSCLSPSVKGDLEASAATLEEDANASQCVSVVEPRAVLVAACVNGEYGALGLHDVLLLAMCST